MASGQSGEDLLKALGIQLGNVPRPRAPPRFFRPPSPLVMERPQPIVPDVSLILDSASTSMYSNNGGSLEANDLHVNRTTSSANNSGNSQGAQESTGNGSSNGISPNMNFANYFPTPSMSLNNATTDSRSQLQQQSYRNERNDSGHGTSPQSASGSGKDDTSVDLSLESDGRSLENSTQADLEVVKVTVKSVLEVVTAQSQNISKLESSLQQILAFQEKFLAHMLRKGSGVSKAVQTECVSNVEYRKPQLFADTRNTCGQRSDSTEEPKSAKNSQQMKTPQNELRSGEMKRNLTTQNGNTNVRQDGRESKVPVSSLGDKNIEDFSTVWKNLQINDVQEPSIFSETSIKSVDFNNDTFQNDSCIGSPHLGPSVSAYGSSSDDEADLTESTSKPCATFYNNLLGQVNRLMEGGQPGPPGQRRTCTNSLQISSRSTPKPAEITSKRGADVRTSNSGSSRGSTASYSSGANSMANERFFTQRSGEDKENFHQYTHNRHQPANSRPVSYEGEQDNVVDVTKKYLQSLGIQFDSPVPPCGHKEVQPAVNGILTQPPQNNQNYMIQQNVYNSIYIPTVNCVPVVSDSLNSNSGLMENLAQKYISPDDLNQYELQGRKAGLGNVTETTTYGMSANNLSFATKQYLQRYGLVNQPISSVPEQMLPNTRHSGEIGLPPAAPKTDRILDITAIRNQPKLL